MVCQPSEDVEAMEELITRVLRNRAAIVEMLDFRRIVEPAIAGVAAVGPW